MNLPAILTKQAMTPNLDKLTNFAAHYTQCTRVDAICDAISALDFNAEETALVLQALLKKSCIAHVFQEATEAAVDEARVECEMGEIPDHHGRAIDFSGQR